MKALYSMLFRVRLETTVEMLTMQIEHFLETNGFEVSEDNKRAFAAIIQHSGETQDYFLPKQVAAMMRKAEINRAAFYVIYPKKYEELKAAEKAANETTEGGPSLPNQEVV